VIKQTHRPLSASTKLVWCARQGEHRIELLGIFAQVVALIGAAALLLPIGPARDILSGFLAPDERVSYGRPVGVTLNPDRALLVADDVGDVIWRVTGSQGVYRTLGTIVSTTTWILQWRPKPVVPPL
jgi:hypothetical protein